MFLNLDNEQQHALDAAKQAFGPMLEGLVKYSIPITLVTFILGLIIALFTALCVYQPVNCLEVLRVSMYQLFVVHL